MTDNTPLNGLISRKILIIDDNDSFRTAFQNILEDFGYTVISAENGLAGLQALEDSPDINLAFVDLIMPLMDGFSFIKTVRETNKDIPIVVISGLDSINDAMRAIHLGAWDFINKPIINLDLLQMTIERNIERYIINKSNEEYKNFLEQLTRIRAHQLEETHLRELPPSEPGKVNFSVYSYAFMAFPIPGLICDDTTGIILDANEAFLALVDASRQAVLGKTVNDICSFPPLNEPGTGSFASAILAAFGSDSIRCVGSSSGNIEFTIRSVHPLQGDSLRSVMILFDTFTGSQPLTGQSPQS